MADDRRRRMSRHIRLVLLGGIPGLLGCAGCCGCVGTKEEPAAQEMEEVEEITEDPPPIGHDHLIGAPFIAWWAATHPPMIIHRFVPRTQVISGNSGYTRSSSGVYRRTYYGGRSTYLYGGGSSSSRPGPVARGGFGGTGHASSGGGS
jgi:uncharacterized membrane protein YgcG